MRTEESASREAVPGNTHRLRHCRLDPEDIAPLFKEAKEINNISLPESFWEVME